MAILPDVLHPNLKIVFCGTAAGTQSAQAGAYYAGRGNRFWDTLFEIGLTPYKLEPREFRYLLTYDIGLTDLVKISYGSDDDLCTTDFDVDGLWLRIERFSPQILAFNGKRAAKEFFSRPVEYGQQTERIGTTALFVLPSTSGAARRWWDISYWAELARRVCVVIDEDDRPYSVYILSCANGAFYTGMTNDLDRRLTEHRAGRGSKWVARRLPVEVAFCLDGLSWDDAREAERYIKTLSRARKQALVNGDARALDLVEKRKAR